MFDDIKEVVQSYPALAVIVMYFWVRASLKSIEEKNGSQDKEAENMIAHSDKNVDELIFGNAFCLKKEDGTYERVDPMKVKLNLETMLKFLWLPMTNFLNCLISIIVYSASVFIYIYIY